jgi:hypothetical protein
MTSIIVWCPADVPHFRRTLNNTAGLGSGTIRNRSGSLS